MPDQNQVRAIVRNLIERDGLPATARSLGIEPRVLTALASGATTRAGSWALAAMRLGLLVPSPAALCSTPSPTA